MARRHRSLLGLRLILVIAIPTMYFVCISVSGLFSYKNSDISQSANLNHESIGFRKLMQSEEPAIIDAGKNCNDPSIQEFPSDGLTRNQRKSGWILIHVTIAIYLYLIIAIVCDDFFVPSIQKICDKLQMTKDVAGATLMAAATSSPELFVNVVGTFVTEGDLGVGTIVGSAIFNILAVPACCGLFVNEALDLDWWPISRDSIAYIIAVILLVIALRDGRIEWYEGLILVITYFLYILAMYFSGRVDCCMNPLMRKRHKYQNLNEESPHNSNIHKTSDEILSTDEMSDEEIVEIANMTKWPKATVKKIWWFLTWPINLVLLFTIPDCRRKSFESWYLFTFIMCIVWIASMSYLVAWDITIIGDTLEIPDSVMGLTFLAAGMTLPEAVSSVIVTTQGHGTMGISNSIGSNVFDILLCLGLPWFIKASFKPKTPGLYYVQINSKGLVYSSVSLFSTLIALYSILVINKFKLDRKVGLACLGMYGMFVTLASLTELNYFFFVNRPTCLY